jgi:hypothetical protein
MDMDQAAVFLAGSILTMMGFIVIAIGIIVINNLLSKYWKRLDWFNFGWNPETARFATPEELKELDKTNEPKLK